ncbi:MAG: hypothetical protein AAFO91_00945 [Bacteroidota bacterium]
MRKVLWLVAAVGAMLFCSCEVPEAEPRLAPVNVFPNPFTNQVGIFINELPAGSSASLRFVNDTNDELFEADQLQSGGVFFLDLSDEPSGLYFLEVEIAGETEVITALKLEVE